MPEFWQFGKIQGREYLDVEFGGAFAMVDHQVAHIYVKEKNNCDAIASLLHKSPVIQADWWGRKRTGQNQPTQIG
jgi:hypothetical protein